MDTLTTDDGLSLRVREWTGPQPARGTVLIVHGLGEHIDRYDAVARRLGDWGWRALGYDHRGHGLSEGARGQLAREDDLLRDLGRVLDAVRTADSGPLVLLGHSMGGAVASRFVAEGLSASPASWHRHVDALVLSSPALAADLSPVQKALMAVFGRLAPNLAVANGLPMGSLSRDPAVIAAYEADRLVHDRVSPRLARFILDAGDTVRERAARWSVPTLLMWGGSDRCVAPRGSAEFAARAPQPLVSSRCFEPLVHEIFNEPEKDEVFSLLRGWLDAQSA